MKNTIKLFVVALVMAMATQSFGMIRLMRPGLRNSNVGIFASNSKAGISTLRNYTRAAVWPTITKMGVFKAMAGVGTIAALTCYAQPARAEEAKPTTNADTLDRGLDTAEYYDPYSGKMQVTRKSLVKDGKLIEDTVEIWDPETKTMKRVFKFEVINNNDNAAVAPITLKSNSTKDEVKEKIEVHISGKAAAKETAKPSESSLSQTDFSKAFQTAKETMAYAYEEVQKRAELELKRSRIAYHNCMVDSIRQRELFKLQSYSDAQKRCAFETIATRAYYPKKSESERVLDIRLLIYKSQHHRLSYVFPESQIAVDLKRKEVIAEEAAIADAQKLEAQLAHNEAANRK